MVWIVCKYLCVHAWLFSRASLFFILVSACWFATTSCMYAYILSNVLSCRSAVAKICWALTNSVLEAAMGSTIPWRTSFFSSKALLRKVSIANMFHTNVKTIVREKSTTIIVIYKRGVKFHRKKYRASLNSNNDDTIQDNWSLYDT